MTECLRGHPIKIVYGEYRYADTGEPTAGNRRAWCGHCGLPDTPEGHDGCLGTLPGVMNACCGHGNPKDAYVQFDDNRAVHRQPAIRALQDNFKSRRPLLCRIVGCIYGSDNTCRHCGLNHWDWPLNEIGWF